MLSTTTMILDPDPSQKIALNNLFSLNTYLYNGLIVASMHYYRKNQHMPSVDELDAVCKTIRQKCQTFGQLPTWITHQTSSRVMDAILACRDNTPAESARTKTSYPYHHPRYKKQSRAPPILFSSPLNLSLPPAGSAGLVFEGIPGVVKISNRGQNLEYILKGCLVKRKKAGAEYEFHAYLEYETLDEEIPNDDQTTKMNY